MSHGFTHGRVGPAPAAVVAAALVAARSFVFVAYEHAHFDSDQAVVGLMARHLGQLEAFPLFFYGQHYLLAVEAWIAAPFLLAFGTSVTSLKLPLLLMNIAIAILLVRLLMKEEALPPWQALCAALFFIIPTPVTASRLVEAQGANIEPFLYVLLLWILRRRPIWFGLVFGIGVLHREFVIYAAVALIIRSLWRRRIFTRAGAVYVAQAAGAACAVWIGIQLLTPLASNVDPATRPPGLHSIDAAALPGRLVSLGTENLPVLFGTRSESFAQFNITSALNGGHPWVAWMLAAAFATVLFRLIRLRLSRTQIRESAAASRAGGGFAEYLVLVGAQAFLAHALVSGAGEMLIRYTLLGLLMPVGATACWLRIETARYVRFGVMAMLLAAAATALFDHARLAAEYAWRRPPNTARELAETLMDMGTSIGRADYWIAYHVTFLTAERVVLDPTEFSRIAEYRNRVAARPDGAVLVTVTPCEGGRRVRRWYICAR